MSSTRAETGAYTITFLRLLSIYLVIPLCFLVVMVDLLVLNGYIRNALPPLPESILVFSLLFPFPHIVASYFSFADAQYLAVYKRRIIMVIPALIVGTILLMNADEHVAFLAFVVYSMIHITFQQTGISQMMLARSNTWFTCWKWSIAGSAIVLYLSLYPSSFQDFASYLFPAAMLIGGTLSLMFLALGARGGTGLGLPYALCTTLLIPLGALFVVLDYPLFAILLPRLTHDLTAYYFYLVHDMNRNAVHAQSYLYRPIHSLFGARAILVVLPSVSIGVAFLFSLHPLLAGYGLVTLSVVHYYIESFMWKKGSPHRAHIAFSNS